MFISGLIILFSLFTIARAELIGAVKSGNVWIQNGCDLYTLNREVKKYPGRMCIFLDDGTFLSASDRGLLRLNTLGEVLWAIPGNFHHQINLTNDESEILALSSEVVTHGKIRERNDVFLRIGLNGKVHSKISSPAVYQQKNLHPLNEDEEGILKIVGADVETSHFNSIYEIPDNQASDLVPYMKAGNIIVNSLQMGIFILTPDFRKVLYHKQFLFSANHTVHDVQVTKEGHFVFFNNDNLIKSVNRVYHSAIQKFDPVKDSLTFEYTAQEREHFFSPKCGGVQDFEDYIFFSRLMSGGMVYSKKLKKIILGIPGIPNDPTEFAPTQQLKIIDPKDFFRNSARQSL